MKRTLAVLLLTASYTSAFGCDYRYEPAAPAQFYRAEGWSLPGVKSSKSKVKQQSHELPQFKSFPGLKAYPLEPVIAEFPSQVFTKDGKQYRMQPLLAKAAIVKLEYNGHVVAYAYGLIPVIAHKVKGKWVVETEAACIFTGTYVDDKGDGVFRVLLDGSLTMDAIPEWAKDKSPA